MESFQSSYHHNKSMKGDRVGRIVVTGPRILYRNREYNSASVALHDYISEFQGTPTELKQSVHVPLRNSNDVLDLLTTPSGHNIYHNDISKTSQISNSLKRGLKLSDFDSSRNENSVQKSIEDSYRRMRQVDGAIQVADALNKSHDVLKKVEEDRLSDIAPSVGDIQSLATESLISFNPFNHDVPSVQPRSHVYSYRTPRPRARTVSDLSLNNRLNKDEVLNTGASTHTCTDHPVMNHKQLSNSLPKPNFKPDRQLYQSNQSTGRIGQRHRNRSRSASPGFETTRSHYHREWLRPPNWLEDQNTSKSRNQNESDFRELKSKLGGRQTPSWIEDIVGSSASSIVLSDQPGLFLHHEDISSVSGHSDPTSLSTTVPSLRLADLELLRESNATANNYKHRRYVRGHVQTSTPMKKPVPSKFYSGKQGTSVGLSEHLTLNTENIDHGLSLMAARNAGDNLEPIYKCSDGKIDHMLRELDVIRQKLKSSSHDTHHCLIDLTPKPGATNLGNKFNVNGQLETLSSDQFHATIDLEKSLSSLSDVNLAALSSITKDLDQGTRTLSLTDNVHHSICQSSVTDHVLEGDRDWGKIPDTIPEIGNAWDDPSTEKKMQGVIREFMNDCLLDDHHETKMPISNTLTGGAQPGSMEALKNMLFKLQSEASSVNNTPDYLEKHTMRTIPAQSIEIESVSSQSNGKPLEDYNFQTEPGGQCLERALVHLSRLQSLVQSDTFNPESKGNLTVQASSSLDN